MSSRSDPTSRYRHANGDELERSRYRLSLTTNRVDKRLRLIVNMIADAVMRWSGDRKRIRNDERGTHCLCVGREAG